MELRDVGGVTQPVLRGRFNRRLLGATAYLESSSRIDSGWTPFFTFTGSEPDPSTPQLINLFDLGGYYECWFAMPNAGVPATFLREATPDE